MGMVMGMIMDPFPDTSFYSIIVEVKAACTNLFESSLWLMCNYKYEDGCGLGFGLGMRRQEYWPYIFCYCSFSSICTVVEGERQQQKTPTCLSRILVDDGCLWP